ncbi:MAG: RNA polymerase factor sigma-54 [Tannerellaceae bacterium]|jgi:RNA polymerase sigma-54 factor|nr:RNA polymerase factor sigma-54 [Tannerellaceae bacterium]
MLKQQLQQKLQLKLSPQQIQLIKLLELPAIEFEERVKHELEENPALEEGTDYEESTADEGGGEGDEADVSRGDGDVDLSLGDYLTEDDIPEYKIRELRERAERKEEIPFQASQSLNEYLLQQLGLRHLPDREMKIAEYIIGNIDDDGYLRREPASIADDLIFQAGQTVDDGEIEAIVGVVQDFDPPGICARNLRECLLLQLNRKEKTQPVILAVSMLTDYFTEFTRKHYDKIQHYLGISASGMRQAMREITALNPKPGSMWEGTMASAMSQITPDFVVEVHGGEIFLSMNGDDIPEMHVSRDYADMFRSFECNKANQTADMREAVMFVKQKLDSAQWFIEAVRRRRETLRRTMEAIVTLQEDFFVTGDEATLRPMILKDVSERAGYDVSTVSRVSNSKYVQTNFGIYPLKYFFSESMHTDSGEDVSSHEVKKIMRERIEAEDKRKPIADGELATILKEKGYIIARRTVAKYREQMEIPVARLRKEI